MHEHIQYKEIIGTHATAATLTATYSDNTKTLLSKYLGQMHLDIYYTPANGQTNRQLYVLIETSNDGGTTFTPLATKEILSTQVKVYTDDVDGNVGPAYMVPGDGTSTGGVTYKGAVDLEVFADYVKISVKESGVANFGTALLDASLSTRT